MENWFAPILLAVILIIVIAYQVVKKNKNRKEAATGEDQARLRQVAEPLLNMGGNSVYAHWEKKEHYGRTTKTTYYHYVVTYKDQTLCIAPLYVDKVTRQMQVGKPWIYTEADLGKVTVRATRKNGAVAHIDLWLNDKQGKHLFNLFVDAENLRSDRFHPVNIVQTEECAAFEEFLGALSARVADGNPNVDNLIKADSNATLSLAGAIFAVIGAVITFFFPPVGGILTAAGLVMAVASVLRGSRDKKYLIVSIVCFVLSAAYTVMYYIYR